MTIEEFNKKAEIIRKDDCLILAVKNRVQYNHALGFTHFNNLIVFVQTKYFLGGEVEILKTLRENFDSLEYKYEICDIGKKNKAIIVYKIKN